MSAFEFVFGFVTIISSLAVTHLAASFVRLIRRWRLVSFSLVQACFMWAAFATTVTNWAAFWPLKQISSWPAWTLVTVVAVALSQYVFCALVTPDLDEDVTDLSAWDEENRGRYVGAALTLAGLAVIQNLQFRQYYDDYMVSILGCVAYASLVLLSTVKTRVLRNLAALLFAAFTAFWLALVSVVAGT